MKKQYSILYPDFEGVKYKKLSDIVCHDLALDVLCKNLTDKPTEFKIIMDTISNITSDPRVAEYRQNVFSDILKFPELRKKMIELFDKFEFIRNFGTLNNWNTDEKKGIWHLFRRMEELRDYITCVETMQSCLTDNEIESDGLRGFGEYIDKLYNDAGFGEMKKDIEALRLHASEVKSITIGINVNERFEATGLGLISVNNKQFKKSGILNNFADAIASKEKIQDGTYWNGDMHYHPVEMISSGGDTVLDHHLNRRATLGIQGVKNLYGKDETISAIPDGDGTANSTFYLSDTLNKLLDTLLRKLRDTLNKYADVMVVNISKIIPEFIYYIRFAEFVEKNMSSGHPFSQATVLSDGESYMDAKGFYNLKLAVSGLNNEEIVSNDLKFDKDNTVYILTGANRGGKTTITQAVGIMYVLAHGGIFVPAISFSYKPLDCIFTHFPADEDKTLDLGRLGEECIRFKESFNECTKDSLFLLNESFSTTSFEEGYYIAKDSVRALLKKSVKTIYNTHMHKLGYDTDEFNKESIDAKVSSLIMRSDEGKRSFKVEIAPPEGMSYARDIAVKYGVTYEMLTDGLM